VILLRTVLALALSLTVVGITLPAQANVSPHHLQKCCCKHTNEKVEDHGCGEPIKPTQDRQCCSNCPLGLALVSNDSRLTIFAKPIERFPSDNFSQKSRFDRPPVPPPRASFIA
jgi:hypothetical protein